MYTRRERNIIIPEDPKPLGRISYVKEALERLHSIHCTLTTVEKRAAAAILKDFVEDATAAGVKDPAILFVIGSVIGEDWKEVMYAAIQEHNFDAIRQAQADEIAPLPQLNVEGREPILFEDETTNGSEDWDDDDFDCEPFDFADWDDEAYEEEDEEDVEIEGQRPSDAQGMEILTELGGKYDPEVQAASAAYQRLLNKNMKAARQTTTLLDSKGNPIR